MMRAVSALADGGLLIPAALGLLAYLVLTGAFAAARLWVAALVACAVITVASKFLFQVCGSALTDLDVLSPSGHVSLACVFYGCLAILVAAGRPRWQGALLAAGVAGFVLLVGLSRVRTGAHSAEEVLLGLGIGGACVGLFRMLHVRAGRPSVSPLPLAIGFLAALLLLGGRHFSLEPAIARLSAGLSSTFDACRETDLLRTRRHLAAPRPDL